MRMHSQHFAYVIACLSMFLYLAGCTHEPADHKVRDAISAYFKAKDYQVVTLEIRKIEREHLGARQYMGPERYIVQIPQITLWPMKEEAGPEDYQDVAITIRKNMSSLYGFSVDSISGIP